MRKVSYSKVLLRLQIIMGSSILIGIGVLALLASILSPYPYDLPHLDHVWSSPSFQFYLGTDNLGYDIFTRLLWGSRESLTVAAGVILITVPLGIYLGFFCAYNQGRIAYLLERLADLLYAFPTIMLAMLVATALGFGKFPLIIAISIGEWPVFFRHSRALVMKVKNMLFVEAARAAGAKPGYIFYFHIFPNIISAVIPKIVLKVSGVIMTEATLSFLGIGIQPPTPSWGNMIRDGLPYLRTHPSLVIIASGALTLTTVGLILLGDGISDWLDPSQG